MARCFAGFKLIVAASALSLSACSGFSPLPAPAKAAATPAPLAAPTTKAVTEVAVAKPSEKPAVVSGETFEKSEQLTDEGEALARPRSMSEALAKFNEALQINPENQRAQFWTAIVKVTLEMKGILARVRPLYKLHADGEKRFDRLVRNTTGASSASFRSFFEDGPADITSGALLQEWMDRVNLRVYEARAKLRELRTAEFTITLNADLISEQLRGTRNCSEIWFGPIRFDSQDSACDPSAPQQVGLNRADFEFLLTALSSYQVHLEVWTAYSVNAGALFTQLGFPLHNRDAAKDFAKALFQGADGRLRKQKPFSGLKEMARDAVQGLQYMLENQRELCPKGRISMDNRRGYLIPFGACLSGRNVAESEELRTIRAFENFVAGQSNVVETDIDRYAEWENVDGNWQPPSPRFHVNLSRLTEDPIPNVKELLPLEFDDCGNLTALETKSLDPIVTRGGTFGDLLKASNGLRTEYCKLGGR